MEYEELKIIGCAMTVYSALGPGFLESVYQNALVHEVRKAGLEVKCERKIQVTYDDKVVGDFSADMLVQNLILIENKAVQTLIPANVGDPYKIIKIGLPFNFGAIRLEYKRKTRTYQPKQAG